MSDMAEFRKTLEILKLKRKGISKDVIFANSSFGNFKTEEVEAFDKIFPNEISFNRFKTAFISIDLMMIISSSVFLFVNFQHNSFLRFLVATIIWVPFLIITILYRGTGSKVQHFYSSLLMTLHLMILLSSFTAMPSALRYGFIIVDAIILFVNLYFRRKNFN